MKVLLTTLNSKYIHKNLAIRWLYVARDKKHQTSFLEYTINDNFDKIASDIASMGNDIVGFSCYIFNISETLEVIKKLKKMQPNVKIALGGPEVSYQYEDYLIDEVDAILLGEGEESFWQYVNEETNIKGLITHNYADTTIRKVDIAYLETLECPYFLAQDLDQMDKHYLYIEASRGCPYQCGYCLASLDNRIRTFSLEYLFNIFDKLENIKVKQVKFLDRTFNADKDRAYQIAQRLIKHKGDYSFQFEIMADNLSDDLIELINNNPNKDKLRFEVGIQSFNEKSLKEMGRFCNTEKLERNVKSLMAHHAIIHGDLIAGLPYEDLASFKHTYQRLFSLKVDEMQIGILKLLRGSKLRLNKEKYNIVFHQQPPYQIISNNWISEQDIEKVEYVALATERLYNRNLCRKTILHLYQNGQMMFDLMQIIGKEIAQLERPYQPHQIFKIVSDHIDEKSKLILLNEYYYLFKQRPVRFIACDLQKGDKAKIFEPLITSEILTNNDIRYAYFDYGYYKGQKVYQVLIYNSDQKYPNRYFISLDYYYLDKEDLNERHYDCNWQQEQN